jgi:hypothetical protein
MSYNGGMNFGLLADYDALPDVDRIAEGIEASLAELVTLARRRQTGEVRTARHAATNGAQAEAPVPPTSEPSVAPA